MALGFTDNNSGGGGGDYLPIVTFAATSGDFLRRESVPDGMGGYEKRTDELTFPLTLAFDFDEIEVGWASFMNGVDFKMVKLGQPMLPKPEGDYKQCFRVRVANKDVGLCEFSHSAKTVRDAMNALHDQYLSGKSNNPGKVAVVEISGVETVTMQGRDGELRFKAPKWSIVDWIDRPAIMSGTATEQVSAPSPTPAADEQPKEKLF